MNGVHRKSQVSRPKRRRVARILVWTGAGLVCLVLAGVVFWNASPWPSVWIVRALSPDSGLADAETAAEFVPDDIAEQLDVVYDDSSSEGRLDVFYPEDAEGELPTIVWVHGGGFIGGTKEPLRNYLKLVASHGFTVVNVEYTHAPEATYPTPVVQVNEAIGAVVADAATYHVDPDRLVLAGDSAGAHIAAQAAMAIAQPDYAAAAGLPAAVSPDQLVATVQYSGAYDPTNADYTNKTFGFFMRTVMWAYSGTKDFLNDAAFSYANLPGNVSSDYPPSFISTGPSDPLLYQGEEWVKALQEVDVPTTVLYFDAATTDSAVGHEYALNLDLPEARQAMVKMVAFLRDVTGAAYREGVSDSW